MIYCKIPKAGLGNQLFVIAHSLIYSKVNKQQLRFTNYIQIKIGPYLRGEKSKRKYNRFFKFQKGVFAFCFDQLSFYIRPKSKIVTEPELECHIPGTVVLFSEIPHYNQFFRKLKPFRSEVKNELLSIISNPNRELINTLSSIDVAVHVRLGDFQKLQRGKSFSEVGATRTPIEYFIDSINEIKSQNPSYKFWVFTDGFEHEVEDILKLESVELFPSINDLVDLFQMSKSKILITSAGSTYSYWAGFLGDCEIIQHPDHTKNLF
jgi:hypothetical protein